MFVNFFGECPIQLDDATHTANLNKLIVHDQRISTLLTCPDITCTKCLVMLQWDSNPHLPLLLVTHTGFKPASDRFVADRFIQLS